jgi:hypothetical protein
MLYLELREGSRETNNQSVSSVIHKARLSTGIIMVHSLGLSIILDLSLPNSLHYHGPCLEISSQSNALPTETSKSCSSKLVHTGLLVLLPFIVLS